MSVFPLQYARALADVVMAAKLDTKEVDRELADFLSTYRGSKELREVMSNPSIELEEKLKVLDAMSPRLALMFQVRNFLAVLLQNDRMYAIQAIVAEYRIEMDARLHTGEAVIVSVRELTLEEKARMEKKASALAGVAVRPVYRQDASLLGGVILRIGDTVYDGSVRRRLQDLREMLLAD